MGLPSYVRPDDAAIAKALVNAALERGCVVSVNDSEEWVVTRSSDKDAILSALASTDSDSVVVRGGGDKAAFWLVYGNGDGTTIADYSGGLLANELYEAVRPVMDRFQ
jgi:hypothetical protein